MVKTGRHILAPGRLGRQSCPMASTVWHYTTVESFQKIVEGQQLWLTEASQLNDSSEISYALSVLRQALSTYPRKIPKRVRALMEEAFAEDWDVEIQRDHFVFSASADDGDSLSQWIHYARPDGVAVAFETVPRTLTTREGHDYFGWHPVVYDPADQQELAWSRIETACFQLRLGRTDRSHPLWGRFSDPDPRLLREMLGPHIATTKHPAFAAEREWRYVERGSAVGPPEFRVSGSRMVRFVRVAPESGRLPIVGFRLGPGAPTGEVEVIAEYLRGKGYENLDAGVSSIPYRL